MCLGAPAERAHWMDLCTCHLSHSSMYVCAILQSGAAQVVKSKPAPAKVLGALAHWIRILPICVCIVNINVYAPG